MTMFSTATRPLFARIAALAILLGALAPTIARVADALGEGGVRWSEVCTSAGVVRVAEPLDGGAPSDPLAVPHCPLCILLAASIALPPPEFGCGFCGVALCDTPPCAASTVPESQSYRLAPHPRGPPVLA